MPTNDFLSPYGALKYESGSAKAASVATQAALTALAMGDPIFDTFFYSGR